MKTIHIKKTKFGFQHCLEPYSSAPTWRYFGPDVKTADDMRRYFETGRHSNDARDSLRDINLFFVDRDGKPQNHYTPVDADDKITLINVNYDRRKRLVLSAADIWSDADRIKYLRDTAIYLPDEIDSVPAALEYLKQYETHTAELYDSELSARRFAAIEKACQEHAAQHHRSAMIDS